MGKRNRLKRKTATELAALDALIETERRRLNHAEAILMCLSAALDEVGSSHRILYSDAVEAANNLITEAVRRLDSVNRARVIAHRGDDID